MIETLVHSADGKLKSTEEPWYVEGSVLKLVKLDRFWNNKDSVGMRGTIDARCVKQNRRRQQICKLGNEALTYIVAQWETPAGVIFSYADISSIEVVE